MSERAKHRRAAPADRPQKIGPKTTASQRGRRIDQSTSRRTESALSGGTSRQVASRGRPTGLRTVETLGGRRDDPPTLGRRSARSTSSSREGRRAVQPTSRTNALAGPPAAGARQPTGRVRQLADDYAETGQYVQRGRRTQTGQYAQPGRTTQGNRQQGRRSEPLSERAAPTRGSRTGRDPLAATASRATTGRSTASAGGKRKRPGGHRRAQASRAFPTVPALAGVATLVVAASGALTLHSGLISVSDKGASQGGMALSVGQLQEARADAAARADRSRRDAAAATAAQDRAAARERAAWGQQHSKEIQAAARKAAGATNQQTFERVIKWVLPVRSFRLTAGFGQAGGMWVSNHTGQDFAAPMGTPIRAVGDGEIISATYDGPYGNKIIIRHTDGTETWYCHMSGYARRSGYVAAGQTIGYVGATGNTTGPHLHFEVHPHGGDAIDPMPWLRRLGLPI